MSPTCNIVGSVSYMPSRLLCPASVVRNGQHKQKHLPRLVIDLMDRITSSHTFYILICYKQRSV